MQLQPQARFKVQETLACREQTSHWNSYTRSQVDSTSVVKASGTKCRWMWSRSPIHTDVTWYSKKGWCRCSFHYEKKNHHRIANSLLGTALFWQQWACLWVDNPRSMWLKLLQSTPDTPLPSMPQVRRDCTYWFHGSLDFLSNHVIVLPGPTGFCIVHKRSRIRGDGGHVTNDHINVESGFLLRHLGIQCQIVDFWPSFWVSLVALDGLRFNTEEQLKECLKRARSMDLAPCYICGDCGKINMDPFWLKRMLNRRVVEKAWNCSVNHGCGWGVTINPAD